MIPSERDKLTRNILKHYQAIKREVEEADEEAEASQYPRAGGSRVKSSNISNPSARGAEILLSVARKRAWITAIDCAMAELERYEPESALILRWHFRLDKLKGYKREYARKSRRVICEHQHISTAQYYNLLDSAISTVKFWAADAGLFKKAIF